MTNEQFDLAMKRFFRCMKDNGYYRPMINYLLPPERTKNDLLNDINDEKYSTNFSMLLGYINLLGPTYKKYGHHHWEECVRRPFEIWKKECILNYPEYLHKL